MKFINSPSANSMSDRPSSWVRSCLTRWRLESGKKGKQVPYAHWPTLLEDLGQQSMDLPARVLGLAATVRSEIHLYRRVRTTSTLDTGRVHNLHYSIAGGIGRAGLASTDPNLQTSRIRSKKPPHPRGLFAEQW